MIPMFEKKRAGKTYSAFLEQEFPSDLALVIVWLVAGIAAIYLPVLNETPIRIVLALPVVLFIPGYGLIAALFPKDGDIGLIERIMLSFGVSIAVVPLVVVGLNFTPWEIQLDTIVISLFFFTLALIIIAYIRRAFLPYDTRFRMPFSAILNRIRQEFLPQGVSRVNLVMGGGNDNLARIVKMHPNRFTGFAHHDLFQEGAAAELERGVKELGLRGYKIIASGLTKPIDDKAGYQLWEKAEELEVPVLIHFGVLGGGGGPARSLHNLDPLSLWEIAASFPTLHFVIPHFGA